jgi:hypothetical protein
MPIVGMGATILAWTDRYPATIVEVFSAAPGNALYITVQEDDAKRIDNNGMSEIQSYEYSANPKARKLTFVQMVGGGWQERTFNATTKRWNKCEGGGNGLRIGERDKYYDFSF